MTASQQRQNEATGKPIRVLALLEGATVTGPAKNLIEFAIRAKEPGSPLPRVHVSIGTFRRAGIATSSELVSAGTQAGLDVAVIAERFVFDPSIVSQLRTLIADQHPDVVQSHNFKSHFLVRAIGAHRPYRWVAFHHGYTFTDQKNWAYNQLDRWSLRGADQVVTVCRPFAQKLERMGVRRERIAVQHNSVKPFRAVSAGEVSEARVELGVSANDLIVLCVGRLSREKGHVGLIRAIAVLRDLSPNAEFRLVIAGEGPERARIEKTATDLGVHNRIILIGQKKDLAPYYALADVAVIPSDSEGSPNVLLESMIAGTATVATNVGGVPEILSDGKTGLLVPRRSPPALADALARLLGDEKLRRTVAAAARQEVLRYDPQNYCDSIRRLYVEVLGRTAK